jgi:tRNA(fMet)-specific endonuclease VapC
VILLDTDHLSIMRHAGSPRARALGSRLDASPDQPYGITIISVVEQFRGWSAKINKAKDVAQEVQVYDQLSHVVELIRRLAVYPFDDSAADQFEQLRAQSVRIGTMDLKIAAIALANGALLLTANRRDFAKVPAFALKIGWFSFLHTVGPPAFRTRSMSAADMPLSTIDCLSAAACSASRTFRQLSVNDRTIPTITHPPKMKVMNRIAGKLWKSLSHSNSANMCVPPVLVHIV